MKLLTLLVHNGDQPGFDFLMWRYVIFFLSGRAQGQYHILSTDHIDITIVRFNPKWAIKWIFIYSLWKPIKFFEWNKWEKTIKSIMSIIIRWMQEIEIKLLQNMPFEISVVSLSTYIYTCMHVHSYNFNFHLECTCTHWYNCTAY
jgi:hypothetical protein